jgi:TolB-like protein/class 3 adenylate cyclase/tetratricopeptide (TPR) repeat protein
MDGNTKAPVELAIAHVLFIDIVGYSKLRTAEQNAAVATLNELVRNSEPFQIGERADRLLKIPTGDGMALIFSSSPEEPVQCAVALSRSLKENGQLQVRMGIHSGSVSGVVDVTGRANVAGAGINIAQRVMDCADGGHILISKHAADDLAEYERWRPLLHDLGSCEVKHGVKVNVASLWSDDIGNSRVPTKLRAQRKQARRKRWALLGSDVGLVAIAVFVFLVWRARDQARTASLNHSVAVLPFESLSTNPDNAVFASGVHREVLLNLAKLADLKVISRTSVMRYKPGTDRNLKQIADELGVNYIVDGSVQREANHIHVTVELINARTDTHAWAETYDGTLADVLGFETEIAQRITNQLGAKLSPRESTELASQPTKDIAAFESYIRARALMETTDQEGEKFKEDYPHAVELLEQAVARDRQFADGYRALAEANIQLSRYEMVTHDYRDRAEQALKDAQRIAPEAGETILAQARIIYYGYYDFEKALTTLERAAKLLPNNIEVIVTRALLYRRFGRWQEAFAQLERAAELNPKDPLGDNGALSVAMNLRWWDDYDRLSARLVKRFPRFDRNARLMNVVSLRIRGEVEAGNKEMDRLNLDPRTHFGALFYRNFWERNYSECRRLVAEAAKSPEQQADRWDKELQLSFVTKLPADQEAARAAEKQIEERLSRPLPREDEEELTETLSSVKMILGKKEEAIRLCQQALEKHPISEDALINTGELKRLAYMYLFAGEHERALQILRKLVEIPGGENYGPLKYNPIFDEFRNDPRFDEILKQSQKPFPR